MEKKEKSDEVIRLTDIGKSYYIGKQEVLNDEDRSYDLQGGACLYHGPS